MSDDRDASEARSEPRATEGRQDGLAPPLTGSGRARAVEGAVLGGALGLFAKELQLVQLVSYWGDTGPLIVLASLGGALAGAKGWLRPVVYAVALLQVAWLAVAFSPLPVALADGLVRRDPEAPADLVYVFGSSIQNDGEPTSPALARLLHGVELVHRGLAPKLVVTELINHPGTADAARDVARRLGLEIEVLSAGTAGTSRQEALELAEWAKANGAKRVLVVTSPSHSKRACGAVEKAGLEVVCSPGLETRFDGEMRWDLETFFKTHDKLLAFGSLIHEHLGLIVYERRGWL